MFCVSNITFKGDNKIVHVENVSEASHLDKFTEVKDARSITEIGHDAMLEMMDATNDCTKEIFKSMVTEESTVLINEADSKLKSFIAAFKRFVEKIKQAVINAIMSLSKKLRKVINSITGAKKKTNAQTVADAAKAAESKDSDTAAPNAMPEPPKAPKPNVDPDEVNPAPDVVGTNTSKGEPEKTPEATPTPQAKTQNNTDSHTFGQVKDYDGIWKLIMQTLTDNDIQNIGESVKIRMMKRGYKLSDSRHTMFDSIKVIRSAASKGEGIKMLDIDAFPNSTRTIAKILTGTSTGDANTTLTNLFNDTAAGKSKINSKITTEKNIGAFMAVKMVEPKTSDADAIVIANKVDSIESAIYSMIYDSEEAHSILENGTAREIFEAGDCEADEKYANNVEKELNQIANHVKAFKPDVYVSQILEKRHVVSDINGKELTKKNATEDEFKLLSNCQRVVAGYLNAITLSCTALTSYELTKRNRAKEFSDKVTSAYKAKLGG